MANNFLLESGSTVLLESGSALQLESGTASTVAFIDVPSRPRLTICAPRRSRHTDVLAAAGSGAARVGHHGQRRTQRTWTVRRGRTTPLVPPQFNPPMVFSAVKKPKARGWPPRRGRSFAPWFINANPNTQYMRAVLADSPGGMWKLDEPSGTTAKDSSGNGHDGTIVGGPTLGVQGALGPAFQFPASAAMRVDVPYGPWMDCTQMSIEYWIQTTSVAGGSIVVRDAGGSARPWVSNLRDTGEDQTFANNQAGPAEQSNVTFNDGGWHHFVGVIDGPGGTVDFYKDGKFDVQRTGAGNFQASTVDLMIGSDALAHNCIAMQIQMVAFYPGIKLTAAQVAAHYQAAVTVPPDNLTRSHLLRIPYRRGVKLANVITTQAPAVNPAITFQPGQRKYSKGFARRGKQAQTTPPQFNPPIVFPIAQRRVVRGLLRRRRPVEVTPAQVVVSNPAIVFSAVQRRVTRAWLRRRRPIETVPAQVVVANPSITFSRPERRVVRGFLRRSKPIAVVPPPTPNPPLVFTRQQRRVQRGWARARGRGAQTVPAQVIVVNPALPGNRTPRRRVFAAWLRRRGSGGRAPQAGVVFGPTPNYVSGLDGRSNVSGSSGRSEVSGADGRSNVTGSSGSTIIQ